MNKTEVISLIKLFSPKGGQITINPNHTFLDAISRDTYFLAHPTEKTIKTFISIGNGFQQWTGLSWVDKTAILRGAPGIDGVKWSKKKTLNIMDTITSNTTLNVNADGTNYTVTGDTITLGESESNFNSNLILTILDNGVIQEKGTDVIWASSTEFQISRVLDNNDKIIVITE